MSDTTADTPQNGADSAGAHEPLGVVVGVDGSAGSVAALRRAREIAQALGVGLEVVTCWRYPVVMSRYELVFSPTLKEMAQREQAAAVAEVFGSQVPDDVRMSVLEGSASHRLVELSARAQLVVVGSRGYGGFKGLLLGSVSSECAAHAACDVLIVRDHSQQHPQGSSTRSHERG